MSNLHAMFARSRQAGYTMLELLIAMTIGGVMVGAVLLAVSGTGMTGTRQGSLAQFTEDGQVALGLLSSQLRMAGFWTPNAPLLSLDQQQAMIRGCRNGFANLNATFPTLICSATAGQDAIAIQYDATAPGAVTRDCLGATAGTLAGTGIAYNRFYIAQGPSGNPALFCQGNGGGAGGQPLIDNVENLRITYGVAALAAPPAGPILFDRSVYSGNTVRYVDATYFTTVNCPRNAAVQTAWCSVTSVRVCVVMRSDNNMAEQANTLYTDCDGNETSQGDRRLRRAMTTTITLRNRT